MGTVDESVPIPTEAPQESKSDDGLDPADLDEVSGGVIIPLPPLPSSPPFLG